MIDKKVKEYVDPRSLEKCWKYCHTSNILVLLSFTLISEINAA